MAIFPHTSSPLKNYWTIAMNFLSWSGYRLTSRCILSRFLMLRLVWCIDCVVTTTSTIPLQHYLGCVCQNGSILRWLSRRCSRGLAPPYLSQMVRIADLPGRRRLCSSSSQTYKYSMFCCSVGLQLIGAPCH